MASFGTTAFAAPGLGLIAGGLMLALGLVWLQFRVRTLADDAPPDAPRHRTRCAVPSAMGGTGCRSFRLGVVTLLMGNVVLPALDTGYLADPAYGMTELSRVRGAVVGGHGAWRRAGLGAYPLSSVRDDAGAEHRRGICLAAFVQYRQPCGLWRGDRIFAGFRGVCGKVWTSLSGGNVLISAAVSSSALAGITGSCLGGHVDRAGRVWVRR